MCNSVEVGSYLCLACFSYFTVCNGNSSRATFKPITSWHELINSISFENFDSFHSYRLWLSRSIALDARVFSISRQSTTFSFIRI